VVPQGIEALPPTAKIFAVRSNEEGEKRVIWIVYLLLLILLATGDAILACYVVWSCVDLLRVHKEANKRNA
jgi:cytochrome b subunit of formate dehydrogenase